MPINDLAQDTSASIPKIKNLYTGLFVPNHHIWLARGLLARKIPAAIDQFYWALADPGHRFANLPLGKMMAFSCHYS